MVLVEEHGLLVGLLTIKDLLKEIIILEKAEHDEERAGLNDLELVLEEARSWLQDIFDKTFRRSRQRVRFEGDLSPAR